MGSTSVHVNGQMAVREGDFTSGAGPPNPVTKGFASVEIGDVATGLMSPANMAEFCKDFAAIQRDWPALTVAQRKARLADAANKQLMKSGGSPVTVDGDPKTPADAARYDFEHDRVTMSDADLNKSQLSRDDAKALASNTYHEARHAEQWQLMARREAAKGKTEAEIMNDLRVSQAAASAAVANPLPGTGPEAQLADAFHHSYFGPRREHRRLVLVGGKGGYGAYRALPEEEDAWRAGDSLPCGR